MAGLDRWQMPSQFCQFVFIISVNLYTAPGSLPDVTFRKKHLIGPSPRSEHTQRASRHRREGLSRTEEAALGSRAPGQTSNPRLRERILPLARKKCHGGRTAARPGPVPFSPVIHDSTDRRQPVDREGLVGLPDDHGRDGNGGGLPAFTPLLVYKVQIAVHSGHLVRSEAVSAVVICGDRKENRGDGDFNLQNPPRQGSILPVHARVTSS